MDDLTLTSNVFDHGELIPKKFTCDGENVNPPLTITGVPDGIASLVLIMDDPDVPEEVREDGLFTHWILHNISPDVTQIPERVVGIGVTGKNTSGEAAYTGPCPPTQYEPTEHRYFFRLYALDTELDLDEGATRDEVEEVTEGHVVAETELMGICDRARLEE